MSDARLRPDEAASESVDSIHFSFYSAKEARKISVKAITKAEVLDVKNCPVQDGLYDPALGPIRDIDTCKSCGQQGLHCPGHYGHIDLARPLFNPLLFVNLKKLLQITCFYCHKFRMGQEKVLKYVSIMKLVIEGNIVAAKKLATNIWDEAVFGSEHIISHSNVDYCKGSWTSIQQTEATSVLGELMRERPNRCEYCNKINPKLKCHTFGWLEKIITSSQIKQNFIQDSSLGLSLAAGKKPNIDSNEDYVNNNEGHQAMSLESVSEGDGDLLEAGKILKGTSRSKELPLEVIKQLTSSGKADLPPSEVEAILKNLWTNESELCMFICDIQCKTLSVFERKEGYAMFFLKALLVPPNKFRPSAQTILGVLEHPQNVLLSKVVEANIALGKAYESHQAILRKWRSLQNSVNLLFDSTKGFGRNEKIPNGIRQLLDKKDGMLRQKMMGKRVNFACRSVISPDPYLAANEIGIPPYFALRLTYPERVTPWNVNKLRKVIMNGANCYPGATHYRDRERFYQLKSEKDMLNAISRKLPTSRTAIKVGKDPEIMFEGKFVYRHLQDGDVVLVNRQPTLHKPGMMAHIVRVLHGEKTIRMHYANCSTYNADFDGDEMNVHFPQDEISRAESIHIVNANKQYIVPTSGDPIRGLIQDHIVSAVLLTKMDTFLTREEYNHLLYASYVPSAAYGSHSINFGQKISALVSVDEVQPLPPSIWKPKQLWTGKQVITAILHHLTKGQSPLTVKKEGRIPKEYFGNDATERQMFVYNNELVHGIIDKAQFGKYGLVHTVHEFYGADIAGRLLAVFSRLFTLFLQMHGFTCGVDDLLIFQKTDKKRRRILKKSEVHSEDVHSRFTSATSDFEDPLKLLKETEKVIRRNGESATTRLDRMMSNALNALTTEVNKVLFPDGLQKPFPNNCLSLMTATGAKGGLVNMTQISSLLGQQELEGKRVPRMASGKTLPCFPAWDISSRAGGFIADRFLTGLRPQEYYFHCMAGREGLVDTAVKTSRSGYLQRCLVKNLESLKVGYDHTVRDADGSIIQFTYGEDGVDVQKSSFLGEFEILSMNQKALLDKLKDQLGYAHLSKSNCYVKELPDEIKEKATHFFSLLSKNLNLRGSFKPIKVKKMMKLVKLKYLLSLAEPGEAVGVLAAQSVGEPSTQMTLNTFHFAGRGEMNVTLGIPRLTEILISAKVEISTPVMTCPLLSWRTREDADIIAAKLGRICLADVIERMEVCTVPFYASRKRVFTVYKLILKLYSPELYPPHSGITLEQCMNILQTVFLKEMVSDITKYLVSLSKISDIKSSTGKKDDELIEGGSDESESKLEAGNAHDGDVVNEVDSDFDGDNGDGDDDDNDGDGDDDDNDGDECEDLGGDAEKRKRQVTDEMDYDDDTENENDGMQTGSEVEEDDNEAGDQPPSSSPFEEEAPSQSPVKEAQSEVKEKFASKKHISKCDRILLTKLNGLEFEVHFRFHQHEPHVLLAELAQKTAKRVFIKACSNIKHCSVVEPKRHGDPILLQTAGVNFGVLQDLHEYIDINKIVTNNIHEMLKTYGVEAARATIINEVKGVFDAYGIRVNIRHLMLIADLMTCNGEYRALNRAGMRRFSTSPFSKMSFETATNTIMEAAFHGEVDNMESPSACISLGKVVKLGTGGFDLLQNVQL